MDNKFLLQKRIDVGLSQARIADILGYSVQTISLWESDKGSPSLPIWGKYASLLKVDLEGFLFNKDKKDNDYCDTYSFDVERFSNNLRRLRKHNGVTQAALAKAINSNTTSIIRFEKGTSFPSLDQFISLCNFYHQSIDELYFAVSFKKDIVSKKNKKGIILPIILPIVVVVAAGGIATGVVISNNHRNMMNNTPFNADSISFSSTSDDSSQSSSSSSEDSSQSSSDSSSSSSESSSSSSSSTTSTSEEQQSSGEIVYFGYYPQSYVSDAATIEALNQLTSTNAAGYFEYQDEYYYKETAVVCEIGQSAAYYFDDDTKIINGQDYWFKCEPIEWEVKSETDTSLTLLSTKLIDSQIWHTSAVNNYKNSHIRSWLNNEFYTMAFSLTPGVLDTEVDNSVESTGATTNHYVCENTIDKVFLPSAKEMLYGVMSYEVDNDRKRYATEFNRIRKTILKADGTGHYWTRSPSYADETCVLTVGYYGEFQENTAAYATRGNCSIRPMIRIPK